jgi:hypothetical protein
MGIASGVLAGIVIKPHGPWKDVFEAAAAGAVPLIGTLTLALVVGFLLESGSMTSDQTGAFDLLLFVPAMIPIYFLALVGAVGGKLLGRLLRRSDDR